jgi:hypothetical protein
MERTVKTKNTELASIDKNMRQRESVLRLILSAFLVSVLLIDPSIQLKIFYVVSSLYLFTTALIKWDPIYAMLGEHRANVESSGSAVSMVLMRPSNIDEVESRAGIFSANDSGESEGERKKAG